MRNEYLAHFGEPATLLVRAPGRINLIGEHTDYNDGFVFPAAIDKAIMIAVGHSENGACEVVADDMREVVTFEIAGGAQPKLPWAKYVWGMFDGLGLLDSGRQGFHCVFGGDIPVGAGLSSSAALCTGLGLALNELYGLGFDRDQLALIAQRAEREFAGVHCGLMDQYASLFGREGHFLKLDCRDLSFDYVPADLGEYRLLLCDTRVKHSLAASAYNRRREECAEGLAALQRYFPDCLSLRDANLDMLRRIQADISQSVMLRCQYVLEENIRVGLVEQALQVGNLAAVGACLYATHRGLQLDYEVSCPELDFLVDLTMDIADIPGARMMGGGFGGCTLNLIHESAMAEFQELATVKYGAAFGHIPLFYEVKIGNGGEVYA